MAEKSEYLKLENLGSGAAAELFQVELGRLIENVQDPNTKPDAVRSVTLTLKVKPGKDRGLCLAEIDCKAKLAPALPFETQIYTGIEKGKPVATEYRPTQQDLFGTNEAGEKVDLATGEVVDIKSRRAQG